MNHAEFSASLCDPARPVPSGLRVRAGASLEQRFAIHRNNTLVRLVDALGDTYPVVQTLVGESFFRALGREFVRQHPPASPVLTLYGAEFTRFVRGHEAAAALPYLGDVAELEWLRQACLHAANARPLSVETLATCAQDPGRLATTRWHLHPSVGILQSRHPVVSLWTAHQHAGAEAIVYALQAIDHSRGESALVIRADWDVLVLPVSAPEAMFVAGLVAGRTIPEAAADAQAHAVSLDLPTVLAMLMQLGAFVEPVLPSELDA